MSVKFNSSQQRVRHVRRPLVAGLPPHEKIETFLQLISTILIVCHHTVRGVGGALIPWLLLHKAPPWLHRSVEYFILLICFIFPVRL